MKYHLKYEFLGVTHEQTFPTLFEFAEALNRVMDLAEVPQSTIEFKTIAL